MPVLRGGAWVGGGTASTWGRDQLVTHTICVDCATQATPDPGPDVYAWDGCDRVVDTITALTRFRVVGHLEGPLQLCASCGPDGPATYWTRDLDDHLVAEW